jgi:hypothetical protein
VNPNEKTIPLNHQEIKEEFSAELNFIKTEETHNKKNTMDN